jgi:TonB family protein
MKNLCVVVLFFFVSLNVFCQGIRNQLNEIKYVPIGSLNTNNSINILDIDDYISILNDKRINIVFMTDNLFAFENNSIIYTISRNGYKTLIDFSEGKRNNFRNSSSYYTALELNLTSQEELDSYQEEQDLHLRELQIANSLRLFSIGEAEIITDDYFPAHMVSSAPIFDERQIMGALVYPPIALRSEIEGRVILELFVNNEGQVQQIRILQEDPLDRGFGEAAVRAFLGIKGEPARAANGEAVSTRYRYPVRFTLR